MTPCQVFFMCLLGKKDYHELNFIFMPTIYHSQKLKSPDHLRIFYNIA